MGANTWLSDPCGYLLASLARINEIQGENVNHWQTEDTM